MQTHSRNSLKTCLAYFSCDFDVDKLIEDNSLLDSVPLMEIQSGQSKVEPLVVRPSLPRPPPSIAEPPNKLVLKPLPDTLKYAFLGPSESWHVIIASVSTIEQELQLMKVLKAHKEASNLGDKLIRSIDL